MTLAHQRIKNVTVATLEGEGYGLLHDAVVCIEDGSISYVGNASNAPTAPAECDVIDGQGKLLTPGLIDCHTHLVWAGSRADEFARRLHGVSYAEIAAQGGGIAATVRATRAASEAELVELATPRLAALMAEGVTTVEIKSGYGLSLADERKQLRAARQLASAHPVSVQTTLLAAHALPPEFKDNADAYIDLVVDEILPTLAGEGLADAVDAFCESVGFSPAQTERVFAKAQELGLPVKLHAEQLSNQNGSALAARYQALSCDHLEHLDEAGVQAMANSGTVAVLLPGAFYFLRDTKLPPLALLREYQVPMALATDANPGTSPILSLQLMLQMGATLFRMTPEECLRGVTCNAATALGLTDRGRVREGLRADLCLWDCQDPAELTYQFGTQRLAACWHQGVRR
ncbi:imidazolonepropionase [Pseudidiomarina terrestris]|uniref:Imidazolonepropionase n=1 Tax=Pseudidiomarina terrestris TaxID=2820060 RepID=A0AAW7QY71_9GAMM|nr:MULTISPECIES: imidazolonepropionase [unclassified Pseudidiomarina]MDN7124813.1 imidazolonepropionase [Pseudidiomarina sp. 1APP75-32.1]MDN7129713.1 imidazolonepropionase [Pseudidiomarina sp. 1APR75-15]MDN7136502.1 imidazolonepropionase [Pseudidiomarina sp. 1ASP75-5]